MAASSPQGEGLAAKIRKVQTVIPVTELQVTLDFFTNLGFKVEAIYPADDPRIAELHGHGHRLRLERGASQEPAGRLRLLCASTDARKEVVAPNGTVIELCPEETPLEIPPLQSHLVISRLDSWTVGRASMRYRDLLPGRLGGRFIASLIHVPESGPVPDYVHFHNVRFQFIFVVSGWVKVVYEDQGEPFVMQAGDCVLQPPQIRHRVLESSGDLYVVEVGCPAEHETRADPALALPNGKGPASREWSGQKFCRFVASDSSPVGWRHPNFVCRDTGIGIATGGLCGVRVVRPDSASSSTPWGHHTEEFLLTVLLKGGMTLRCAGGVSEALTQFHAFSIPAGTDFRMEGIQEDSEWLEVSLPAQPNFVATREPTSEPAVKS